MPVPPVPKPVGPRPQARFLITLLLLWLAGNSLRLTIIAVPPIIPLIHDDLGLNGTQIGILTGLPAMLFAFAAVPGSLLISRLGVRAALIVGLGATAVFGAVRGAIADVAWLYAATIAMAGGVAVMQVAMPPAVRDWFPQRIGFATAVYTNGLLIGETLPAALTLPLVLPMAGGSWQWTLAAWSAPVAVIAAMAMWLAPADSATKAVIANRRWWPDWNSPLIWRLGIMLGVINATYFTTNAFLPDYLRSNGQSEWISAALSGLNIGQLPASFALIAIAGRLERKIWPYVTCGLLCLAATVGIVVSSGVWVVVAATVLGFFAAAVLVLILALPPLLSAPEDVHRVTAAMFTISYSCAVIVPILSGLVWDLSGIAGLAFAPVAICGFLLAILAPAIHHVRPARS